MTSPVDVPTLPLRILLFRVATIFVPLLLVTGSFSALHPMSGYPDENVHPRYAYAVVTGQLPVADDAQVTVPSYLTAEQPGCWRFESRIPATCALADPMSAHGSEPVRAITTAANYPPLYYALVGWPLRWATGHEAVMLTRWLSAAFFSALAATAVVALTSRPGSERIGLVAPWLILPGTLSLGGAINPQGLEIGAAMLLAGCAWPLARDPARPIPRITGMTVAAVLLILSRPSGPIWAVELTALAAIAVLPALRRPLPGRVLRGYVLACAAACGAWLAWRVWTRPEATGPAPEGRPGCGWLCVTGHLSSYIWYHARRTIGVTGWDDAPMPPAAAAVCLALLATLLVAALVRGTRTVRIALSVGVLLIPLSAIAIERQTVAIAGYMWQARYALPLVIPLIWLAAQTALASRDGAPLAAPTRDEHRPRRSERWTAIAAGGIVLVQAGAIIVFAITAARRFWIGLGPAAHGSLPADATRALALLATVIVAGAAASILGLARGGRRP